MNNNKEYSAFDFLNHDKYIENKKDTELLDGTEFQIQIITDILLNMNNKIKFIKIINDNLSTDNDYINLNYSILLQYKYDQYKDPLNIIFKYIGNDVKLTNINNKYNVNWDDIDINLYTRYNDKIRFKGFIKSPNNIKLLLKKILISDIIESKLDIILLNK